VARDAQRTEAGSYRTYEEWKPYMHLCDIESYEKVLTVPMRNGNYGYLLPSGSKNTVLTVPMRNGNQLM